MRTVTVTLSLAEAKALDRMADNTSCDPDAMDAVLGHPARTAAGYRAHQKLHDTIYRANVPPGAGVRRAEDGEEAVEGGSGSPRAAG